MSAPHASSDDEFQDDLQEFNEAQFDSILAEAQTQASLRASQPSVPTLAQSQPAPPPSTSQHPPSDDFSDDEEELDADTLEQLNQIEEKFATTQQQLATPSAASPIHAATPSSAAPVVSSSIFSQPTSPRITTSKPVAASSATPGVKRARTPEREPPRKRARSSSKDTLDPDRDANAHQATIEKLLTELQCPICSDHIVHPHSLPRCGHCACAPCLNQWLTTCAKAGKLLSCPICREIVKRSDTPAPAFIVLSTAQMLAPHLDMDSQKSWRERTEKWGRDWTFKAEPGALNDDDDADENRDDAEDDADDDDDDDNYSSDEDDVTELETVGFQRRSFVFIDLT